MRRAIAAVALLGLMACGGDSSATGDVSRATTSTVRATTTTLSGDELFLVEIRQRTGWTEADAQATLEFADALCGTLTAAVDMVAEDAVNDTPQTDASILAEAQLMAIGVAFSEYTGPDELLAEILTVGAKHICPDQREPITAYIDGLGIVVDP